MNQRRAIDDQRQVATANLGSAGASVRGAEWMTTREATTLLGIKRESLYAYASRGLVRSTPAPGRGTRQRVYHRADVERLRARSQARAGHGAVAASALRWGEPVLETSVGAIGPAGPIYRGHSALVLAREGASFEAVCELLWSAPFRPEDELDRLRLGAPAAPLRALLKPGAQAFDGMLIAAAALAAAEQHTEPSLEVARARAPALLRRLVASCALVTDGGAVTSSLEAETTARALLTALGGRTTAASLSAINEALVLCADHELNASTFTARVASSAGSSLPACIVAALATLSGPLHGAATARVEAFLAEVGRPERGAAVVREHLGRGESIPGFGHVLYPGGDPRGARLLELAARIGARSRGVRIALAVVDAMDLVARERPTMDLALVALAAALGLPRGAPLAIFACGRLGGWIAHALEQRAADFMLRPRARYVGPILPVTPLRPA